MPQVEVPSGYALYAEGALGPGMCLATLLQLAGNALKSFTEFN